MLKLLISSPAGVWTWTEPQLFYPNKLTTLDDALVNFAEDWGSGRVLSAPPSRSGEPQSTLARHTDQPDTCALGSLTGGSSSARWLKFVALDRYGLIVAGGDRRCAT